MLIKEFSPVCLFVYNRLEFTIKTIESLQNNLNAKLTDLIIFSDAPKSFNDSENVKSVRDYIKNIDKLLFKSILIIEQENNLGLACSIINGVTLALKKNDRVIVLEDDIVTSKFFLTYMNEALELYQNDEKVASIHAWTIPLQNEEPTTYFLRGADCWGWATWKRAWYYFEPDGKNLLNELKERNLIQKFDLETSCQYSQMLRDQIDGKNNSWAIRWHASTFLKEMLTLYPRRSLVQNIGFNNPLSTHTKSDDHFKFYSRPIEADNYYPITKIPLVEDQKTRCEIIAFLKRSNSIFFKFLIKLRKYFRIRNILYSKSF